jgi:inosine/xanthosine triphosphate pyrophosphatase family protein
MSKQHKPLRRVVDSLNEEIRMTNLPPVVKLFVVFGYPRSDIGKGTLVSHLLPLLEDSNVIKFDGLLNTDLDGRFTDRGHDDFGLYVAQQPDLQISKLNHLMSGNLFRDFIVQYAETNERLTFMPHLELFFRLELQRRWKALGEPRNLILEMGGSPDDAETSYAVAAIRDLKAQLGTQCQILLLTELGHNNVFAKSRVAQRGVSELASRGVVPDIILTREPYFDHDVSVSERLDFEIQIQERVAERTGIVFNNIISMPYFKNIEDGSYTNFLQKNLMPIIDEPAKYPQVLLGTTDRPEIEEWEMLLGERFSLTNPQLLGLDIEVKSDDSSILRSSRARARSFSRLSGLPTITAEAGLYINALDGRPGAGVRTWGGELEVPMNNEEVFGQLQKAVQPLKDTSAYIEASITVVMPNGEEYDIRTRDYGYIHKDRLSADFKPDQYPIGQVFVHDKYGAPWAEMTPAQRRDARKERLDKILGLLSDAVETKNSEPAGKA